MRVACASLEQRSQFVKNLVGQQFGFLKVLSIAGKTPYGMQQWLCRCVCGNECSPCGADLKRRPHISCGCQQRRLASEANLTHGKTGTPEHHSWTNMLARCRNSNHPRFADYGGRGITVCDRWQKSFVAFLEDMGLKPTTRHSIERMNNDGDYCPLNCRWASPKEQNQNTRVNRLITHDGKTMTLSQWANFLNTKHSVIGGRLDRGWSVAEALTIPVNRSNKLASIRRNTG